MMHWPMRDQNIQIFELFTETDQLQHFILNFKLFLAPGNTNFTMTSNLFY